MPPAGRRRVPAGRCPGGRRPSLTDERTGTNTSVIRTRVEQTQHTSARAPTFLSP